VFLAFLGRLVRHLGRKIHLVVDGHPVHRRVKRQVARANPANPAELADATTAHLRRQHQPDIVKALFGKPAIRYAAG
jgi:hypothetical protein